MIYMEISSCFDYDKLKFKNKKCALFDLDGTLVDTADDLSAATEYVLKQFGRKVLWSKEDYRSFVGNGAMKLLERAFEYTLSESELNKAFALFKEKYNVILNDNAYVYDGIRDALDYLKSQGMKLAVVTNKPHKSAVIMVKHFFGEDYFDFIIGAKEDRPKKPDPYSVNIALDKLQCRPCDAVFLGDSDVDVLTGKNSGMETVGCSWGFRAAEVLESAAPTVIIDMPKKILKLF